MSGAFTRVMLGSVPKRRNVYLRFGRPSRRHWLDADCRFALFAPEQVFCRVWWEANAYGTTRWQVAIVQARAPGQYVQRLAGVAPGAAILLAVEGERSVKALLRLISTIETFHVNPTDVSTAYWRVLQTRLAAGAELSPYGLDRDAAERLQRGLR